MKPPPHTVPPLVAAHEEATAKEERCFDWAMLALLVHPMQVAIVEALLWIGRPLSAKDFGELFADEIDRPSNAASFMSYHVKELAKIGALELVRTESVRGALRKFYVLVTESQP